MGNDIRTVLVVEDDQSMRELLWRYLGANGWRVLTAGDGLTALQVLEDQRVDAVIADERTPGLAGPRMLSYVRYTSPGAKLVLFSGYASSWGREIAKDLGATVIMKGEPDSLGYLLEVLNG